MRKKHAIAAAIVLYLGLAGGVPAVAQQAGGCRVETLSAPARVVYRCANGLTIEAENQAELRAILPDLDTPPTSVSIKDRAVLIELPKGNGPFQIRTPHAIASVRGTVYVVDATRSETSVFVVEGVVRVARKNGYDEVSLAAGEGVVVTGDAPLIVRKWPDEKVARLLGRFAR